MAFPLVLGLPTVIALAIKGYRSIKKLKNAFSSGVDDIAHGVTKHKEEIASGVTALTALAVAHENDLITSIPAFNLIPDILTTNPSTMPEYLQQQNEHLEANKMATENVAKQTLYNNELIAKQIKKLEETRIESEAMRNMLDGYMSSFLIQFQELSKIPASMSLKSDIDTAYSDTMLETQLAMNDTLTVMKEALLSSAGSSANSAISQLSIAQKMTTVADNASSQKEVADFTKTPKSITNLDGNEIAHISPMEAHAIKSAVNAKNETDEMEFELPDDILDFAYSPITLPNYTYGNNTQDVSDIADELRNMNV